MAGIAVAAAGVYQLTPLKRACLRHCRTPLHFVMHRWREGGAGALALVGELASMRQAALPVAAALGGMVVPALLFLALNPSGPTMRGWGIPMATDIAMAVGVMSLAWMAIVAAVILSEKVLPVGARLPGPVALCLVGLGVWIAIAPGGVPGLTQPGAAHAMTMEHSEPGGMMP